MKIIKNFNLDLSDLPAATETRSFNIIADKGAEFILEIKNEDNYYYNFVTKTFQAAKTSLEDTVKGSFYRGIIKFPTVTDDDHYDIYLYAKPGTKHVDYEEVRFGDGSIDINSSIGSNSLMMTKIIYQYTDLTLTLSMHSAGGTIETGSLVNGTITTSRGRKKSKEAFSISCSVTTATKSYRIIKQPDINDVISFSTFTVGSAPEILPGENEYPTITETAQVQTGGISSSATIVLRAPVPDITVGDKWTSDGAMPAANQYVQSVTTDGDGNITQFVTNTAASHASHANLTFYARKNYQWPLDSIDKTKEGMIVVPATNVTANTKVGKYRDVVVASENTAQERVLINNRGEFKNTKGKLPTVVKGLVTVQPGNIVFDKQQILALAGDTIKIGGYGTKNIKDIYDYDVKITDLSISLTPITTTTTSAVVNNTSVPIASRNGIIDSVSTVSGIGIDSTAVDPTVSSGAGSVSGAGTIVLSAAQTLENGITLTFANAGQTATITGNIEVVKAGTSNQTIRFDVDKLLSIT